MPRVRISEVQLSPLLSQAAVNLNLLRILEKRSEKLDSGHLGHLCHPFVRNREQRLTREERQCLSSSRRDGF